MGDRLGIPGAVSFSLLVLEAFLFLVSLVITMYKTAPLENYGGLRPYHPEHARSRLISEAKKGRAWLVLGWETAWEYQVL